MRPWQVRAAMGGENWDVAAATAATHVDLPSLREWLAERAALSASDASSIRYALARRDVHIFCRGPIEGVFRVDRSVGEPVSLGDLLSALIEQLTAAAPGGAADGR